MSTRQFAGGKWMVLIVFAWTVNSTNSQAQQSAAALRIAQTEAQQSAPDGVSPSSANGPRISKPDQSYNPATLVVPDRAVYEFFLQHVGHEDERFREAEAAYKDTSTIRWDYAGIFKLSDEQTAQMLSTAINGYYAIPRKRPGIPRLHPV